MKETTQKNTREGMLKTTSPSLRECCRASAICRTVSRVILSELSPLVGAQHAAFLRRRDARRRRRPCCAARQDTRSAARRLPPRPQDGEGLVGQCALEKSRLLLGPPRYVPIGPRRRRSAPPPTSSCCRLLFEGDCKPSSRWREFTVQRSALELPEAVHESIGVVSTPSGEHAHGRDCSSSRRRSPRCWPPERRLTSEGAAGVRAERRGRAHHERSSSPSDARKEGEQLALPRSNRPSSSEPVARAAPPPLNRC